MQNRAYRLILVVMLIALETAAQPAVEWSELPSLPGGKGWAGMYAGVSHGALICMGGANFPDKYPWEGGKKKWYDDIYVLTDGEQNRWLKVEGKLPVPSGYGVSVSYQNTIILVGGSNENGHLKQVIGYEWNGKNLVISSYPALPISLANMAGTLVGDVIVIVGGLNSPTGTAVKKCYTLDLKNRSKGWVELDAWPGSERMFPVCTTYKGQFYLFGGETVAVNSKGQKYRSILLDSFRLSLKRENDRWNATWEMLAPMPRGMSAGGTVLPVLNDHFLFWGGVDAVTSAYKNPATHPGIIQNLLFYFPETDTWEFIGQQTKIASRVTLPVVFWNNRWVYVSGEIKPGIRTPSVVSVK
jgi:N-acetylneuraminate epimerase